MPVTKGDVQIYYETRGSRDGVPMLLAQGFTWQLIGWREGFCEKFGDRGAFVILYDNRDVGFSQKFGGPDDYDGGYSLTDMAGDGFSVLDDLGLASAHVVGASMGGMIAQIMALSQPSRVRSLNLIYTAPGIEPRYSVQPEAEAAVLSGRRLEREEALKEFVERERASASTAYPYDEEWIRDSVRTCTIAATRRTAYFVSSVRCSDGRKSPRRSAASRCPPQLFTGGPTGVSGSMRPSISDVSLRIPSCTSIRAWAMKSKHRSGTSSRRLSCGPQRAPDESWHI